MRVHGVFDPDTQPVGTVAKIIVPTGQALGETRVDGGGRVSGFRLGRRLKTGIIAKKSAYLPSRKPQ